VIGAERIGRPVHEAGGGDLEAEGDGDLPPAEGLGGRGDDRAGHAAARLAQGRGDLGLGRQGDSLADQRLAGEGDGPVLRERWPRGEQAADEDGGAEQRCGEDGSFHGWTLPVGSVP
jgi:hypothetical protein